MRLRRKKGALDIISNSKYLIKDAQSKKGKWQKEFNNSNPIMIEIGMGKGDFIINNAIIHPNINYIGIEKYDTVLVSAVKKVKDLSIPNLRFIWLDATKIEEVFDHEIDKIYLNFSDPWPKKKHHRRRLTSSEFLNRYENIFKKDIIIEQKTDNEILFNYSKESFKDNGYSLMDISNNYQSEVLTEYESRFKELGKPIYHLTAKK